MIPLEVVTRGIAAGSFVRRHPGVARGSILVPRVLEFFLKDDANHDPMIEPEAILAQNIATPPELGAMSELARIVFEILAHAWRRHDTLLVDLKIEFGRIASGEGKGQLVVADVVDNDAWRVWPQGREELMLDKQLYRNLPEVKSRRSGGDQGQLRAGRGDRRHVPADAAGDGRGARRRSGVRRTRRRDREGAGGLRVAHRAARRVGRAHAGLRAPAGHAGRCDVRAGADGHGRLR